MNVLQRIRQLMEARGWTDYRLSQEAKVSQTTISNMFKRSNAPTLPTLEAICDAFGVTLTEFFADGKEPFPLTEEQQALLAQWSVLTDEQKKALLDLMNVMNRPER